MRNLILLLCLILSQISYAGTIDPNKLDSSYIEYGNKHKCVLRIGGNYQLKEDKVKPFVASCVVIRPKIVLTAAHVVYRAKNIFILDENDIKINVLVALYLNEWDENKLGPNDIAICILDEDILLDFYPELYQNDDEIDKICSISGFGVTGNFIEGFKTVDNKKRAGSNFIDEIFDGMLVTSVKNNKQTELEFLISYGDSGGGLFINNKLAGINSGIMTDAEDKILNSDQKDFAIHTRISMHRNWIKSVIEKLEKK